MPFYEVLILFLGCTVYFSHILHYYTSSIPNLIEHAAFFEAPPSEICNVL